jgi:hypothetical protein
MQMRRSLIPPLWHGLIGHPAVNWHKIVGVGGESGLPVDMRSPLFMAASLDQF